MIRYCLGLLMLLLFSLNSFADEIDLHVTLDTNSIRIGEWVQMNIEVTRDEQTKLVWPMLEGTVLTADSSELEIVSSSPVDTVPVQEGLVKESRKIMLTVFDSGYYVIPPIQFKYQLSENDSFKTLESEPILLSVHTVNVDTTLPIKPIKAPLNLPFRLSEITNYIIIGGVALLLLIGVLYYFKTRKKKPKMIRKVIQRRPPHEIALEKLRDLEEQKIWQQGDIKQYYSQLSEITREYIEGRYSFLALESTTDEIMAKFSGISVPQQLKEKLQDLLQTADLVKFAKSNPLPDENKRYLDIANEFVRATKTEEQAENIVVEEEQA